MKRSILDFFEVKRITRSSPRYPILESKRKEFQFDTFYTSNSQNYFNALNEIKQGEKRSHWIWFILPQLACLGSSYHAVWYGIKSFPEAQRYLHDNLLGLHLIEISQEILKKLKNGSQIRTLMGSGIDAAKLLSCVTLFYFVSYQTNHEMLFKQLRQICEKKLKRQDNKTIEFCEISMEKLNLEIPQDHKIDYIEQKEDNNDNNNNDNNDNNDNDDIPSSQLSQPLSEIIKSSSISSTINDNENLSQQSDVEKLLSQIPETPTHDPHLNTIPKRSEFNFKPFLNSSDEYYQQALDEMKLGHKSSHWIWFILPQIEPLGMSHKAKYFGIKSFEEGLGYLQHYVLGTRLIEISRVILEKLESNCNIKELMGSRTDALKLLSCSTLFFYVSFHLATSPSSTSSSNLSSKVPSLSSTNSKNIEQKEEIDENQSFSQMSDIEFNNSSQLSDITQPDYKSVFKLFKSLREICEDKIGARDFKTIKFCEDSMKQLNFPIPVLPDRKKQNQDDDDDNNNNGNNNNNSEVVNLVSNSNEATQEEKTEGEKEEEEIIHQKRVEEAVEGDGDQYSVDSGSHEYNAINDMELESKDENGITF